MLVKWGYTRDLTSESLRELCYPQRSNEESQGSDSNVGIDTGGKGAKPLPYRMMLLDFVSIGTGRVTGESTDA